MRKGRMLNCKIVAWAVLRLLAITYLATDVAQEYLKSLPMAHSTRWCKAVVLAYAE